MRIPALILRAASIIIVFLGTIGCATKGTEPRPVMMHEQSQGRTNYPTELLKCPILDVHTHTFNAKYLPLKNIALARRYDWLPLSLGYLIPDTAVILLADVILSRSDLSPIRENIHSVQARKLVPPTQAEMMQFWSNIAAESLGTPSEKATAKAVQPSVTEKTMRKADKAALRLFGKNLVGKGETPRLAIARFVYFLTANEVTLRSGLLEQEFPETDKATNHQALPFFLVRSEGSSFGQRLYNRR